MSEQPLDLRPRTKAFALRVIRMYSKLPKNDAVAQVLGKQVLRSGTSVGANYREASRGRSCANCSEYALGRLNILLPWWLEEYQAEERDNFTPL